MRIYMQTATDQARAPRFYQILLEQDLLEGWTLVREWGQQGSPGRVVREHFSSREEAEEALVKWRDSQLQRGYKVMFARGQDPEPRRG